MIILQANLEAIDYYGCRQSIFFMIKFLERSDTHIEVYQRS